MLAFVENGFGKDVHRLDFRAGRTVEMWVMKTSIRILVRATRRLHKCGQSGYPVTDACLRGSVCRGKYDNYNKKDEEFAFQSFAGSGILRANAKLTLL
jgi:hypothetical protein